MKLLMDSKLNSLISYCLLLNMGLFLISCEQSQNDSCIIHFKSARNKLNSYYKTKDSFLLLLALNDAQHSLQCDKTKRGAIEIKLSVFALLKQYENGYKYVDSLSESDFALTYKKQMLYNYFLALHYESKEDSVTRNKYFHTIITGIDEYLRKQNSPKKEINQEAYLDLFSAKSKVVSAQKIKLEIDSLKEKYPQSKDFFETLRQTVNSDSTIVSATPR